MASVYRHRTTWTGFTGAPGITTTYWNATPDIVNLRVFFNSIAGLIYNGASLAIANIGDVLNEVDGTLTGSWSAASVTNVAGTGVGSYAGPVGLEAQWLTGSVVDGKRVVGRTFIVPGKVSSTNGVPPAGDLSTITAAGNTLQSAAAGKLVIWHRPRKARPSASPPVTFRAGIMVPVAACVAPAKYVTLRSRRD